MDPATTALLAASIGAAAGVGGQLVAARLNRGHERLAWERDLRIRLYVDMLTWVGEFEAWLLGETRFLGTGGEHQTPPPFPPFRSAELDARVQLIAPTRVQRTWTAVTTMHQVLYETGIGESGRIPDDTRTKSLMEISAFLAAVRLDQTVAGQSAWKRRLLRQRTKAPSDHAAR